jgi:hypothetical protein
MSPNQHQTVIQHYKADYTKTDVLPSYEQIVTLIVKLIQQRQGVVLLTQSAHVLQISFEDGADLGELLPHFHAHGVRLGGPGKLHDGITILLNYNTEGCETVHLRNSAPEAGRQLYFPHTRASPRQESFLAFEQRAMHLCSR